MRRHARSIVKLAVLGLFLCAAVSLFGHFAWLSPVSAKAALGDMVTVRMFSGHAFPAGGEPVTGIDLKMTVFPPAGKGLALAPADRGRGLEAAFKAESAGVYRVACEYDRGVISRTPEGWKPGGKSRHPNATDVIKSYNAFLCAVGVSSPVPASGAPLGLKYELVWTRQSRRLTVMALAEGKPVAASEISIVIGEGDAKAAGKTDASGPSGIEGPEGVRGPILLIGSLSRPMPAGSEYNAERTGATYFLNWE